MVEDVVCGFAPLRSSGTPRSFSVKLYFVKVSIYCCFTFKNFNYTMQSKNETSLKYITISFTHQMTRLWRFH